MTNKQPPSSTLKIDTKKISIQNSILNDTAKSLKSIFVGIDNVIDELIDTLRVWYLMPEVLTRPVIINLWGMTGVGKTDLIRRLVSALDFQDRFIEVELANGDKTNWYSSVDSVLNNNSLNDTEPKIILFDEIQRFNTLDEEGKPVTNTKFSDFWELLSDGRLSRREREDIDYLLSEIIFANRETKRQKKRGEEVTKMDEAIDIYMAKQIKKILNLDEEIHEIAEMPRSKIIKLLYKVKAEKQVFEPINHSKSLIIICGNLDDAFSMASETSESDVDADIFNAFTQKVTIVDIKQALSKRFKPEQVARFGNIHIVYRSLLREHFEILISREVDRVIQSTQQNFGLSLTVSENIRDIIYNNGVFPVQGVRPVFSTVNDVLETNVTRFIFEALMNNATTINLDYDLKKQALIAKLNCPKNTIIRRPYIGRLDKIRQQSKADVVANVSVHEAGHALIYGVFFNLAPLQLTSRVASSWVSGFTFPHDIHGTRENVISQIMVYLAGGIAEDIIFGPNKASTGRLSDREEATKLALDFVRKYGFDNEFQATYTLGYDHEMKKEVTDTDVEKMMTRLSGETHNILLQHTQLLIAMSSALAKKGELNGIEVCELAKQHNLSLNIEKEGYLHLPSYAKMLADAVKKQN